MSWAEVATRAGGYAPQASDWAAIQTNMNAGLRVLLEEREVTAGGVTTLVFNNINQDFQHLLLETRMLGLGGSSNEALIARSNGVSTATYDYQTLESIAAGSWQAAEGTLTGYYLGRVNSNGSAPFPGSSPDGGLPFGMTRTVFHDYSDNSGAKEKNAVSWWTYKYGVSGGQIQVGGISSFARQTANIASLELRGLTSVTWQPGSRATLYGIPA